MSRALRVERSGDGWDDRDDEDEHPDDVEWERSGERDVCFLVTLGAGFVAITVIVLVYLEYG